MARDLFSRAAASARAFRASEAPAASAATPNAAELSGQSLNAVRGEKVPPVVGLGRFRDAFEQLPQSMQGALRSIGTERALSPHFSASPARALATDSFQAAPRAPVDLSGGGKPVTLPAAEAPEVQTTPTPGGFSASLDDLGSLLG
jgi:hypothetical protein